MCFTENRNPTVANAFLDALSTLVKIPNGIYVWAQDHLPGERDVVDGILLFRISFVVSG